MSHRNGSLDVLRALAIAMVVGCHLANAFAPGSPVAVALGNGGRGVDLFFVLSGWLLGRQLFAEAAATGTVDVRRFWLRRWLRTLPAYYAVLAAHCALLAARGKAGLIDWRYFVFLQNYEEHLPYFAVSWSLCVEEYFYLVIAPAVFLACRSRWAVAGAAAAVAVLLTLHALGWYGPKEPVTGSTGVTHVRFEQCLTGVLLAWAAVNRPRWWAALCRRAGWLAGLGLGLFVAEAVNRFGWWWPYGLGTLGWALVFASWVLLAVSGPRWERVRAGPARFLAARAYSIYLVHADAFNAVRTAGEVVGPVPAAVLAAAALGACLLAAEVLYRGVERPFTRLREAFPASRAGVGAGGPREPAVSA